MNQSVLSTLIFLSASHLLQGASAQQFTPAEFGDSEHSVTRTLRVPNDRPTGTYDVSLRCQAVIETDGSVSRPHCLAFERYRSFEREALRALTGAVMRPATVDGEAVAAVMSFMIGYRCNQRCEIVLAPNHARNVDAFRLAYSAPQPILENGRWYTGFENKLDWAASGRPGEDVGGVQFIVSTRVNESGRASRTQVETDSSGFFGDIYEDAARLAAGSLRDVRYIPGFYEGEPQTMRLYEYWLDPGGTPPPVLTIPVRVLLLTSETATELDSALTDADVRDVFVGVNEVWKQAAIEWAIESIVHTQAANEQPFLEVTARARESGFRNELSGDISRAIENACPEELLLESGWNVCFLRRLPTRAFAFYSPRIDTVLLDERLPELWSRLLAHELGHSLGLAHTAPCGGNLMRQGRAGRCENGPLTATRLEGGQIARARAQVLEETPAEALR